MTDSIQRMPQQQTADSIYLKVWIPRDPPQKQENLMDLNRSQRRQVRNKFESLQLTKRPTANHTVTSRSGYPSGYLNNKKVDNNHGQPNDVSATRADSIHGNPNAALATTADSINFQEPVSIQWWFHCLNPTDKRSESHSINVCSQRRTGTSLQRKRPRNHLMEGQPILISAGS